MSFGRLPALVRNSWASLNRQRRGAKGQPASDAKHRSIFAIAFSTATVRERFSRTGPLADETVSKQERSREPDHSLTLAALKAVAFR